MKKVKFNVSTNIHMIPDDKIEQLRIQMHTLQYGDENGNGSDYTKYRDRLAAGSPFSYKMVTVGETTEVPDWYYNANKDRAISVGNSFSKYTDGNGGIIPYNAAEAEKHGDLKHRNETMKTVKLFELVR